MKGSETLSVTTASALKELMSQILSAHYPEVFHCGHVVLAATEELEQSDDIRLLKSSMDGIYNTIERLFYKEKIVLFPYLEKHFTAEGKPKTVPAISTSTEEAHRTSKMIRSFKEWASGATQETPDMLSEEQIAAAFLQFENAWSKLCTQREVLFNSFLI